MDDTLYTVVKLLCCQCYYTYETQQKIRLLNRITDLVGAGRRLIFLSCWWPAWYSHRERSMPRILPGSERVIRYFTSASFYYVARHYIDPRLLWIKNRAQYPSIEKKRVIEENKNVRKPSTVYLQLHLVVASCCYMVAGSIIKTASQAPCLLH